VYAVIQSVRATGSIRSHLQAMKFLPSDAEKYCWCEPCHLAFERKILNPNCRCLLKGMQLTLNTVVRVPRKHVSILSKTKVPITAWHSFHWSPFVSCFVYNKPEVKFTHNSSHLEHYKNNCITSHAVKHDCSSA